MNNELKTSPFEALVACDGGGNGCVLEVAGTVDEGYGLAVWMQEEVNHLGDLGLDEAPRGLSVWTGIIQESQQYSTGDYETYLKGTFRPLTSAEWSLLSSVGKLWS